MSAISQTKSCGREEKSVSSRTRYQHMSSQDMGKKGFTTKLMAEFVGLSSKKREKKKCFGKTGQG